MGPTPIKFSSNGEDFIVMEQIARAIYYYSTWDDSVQKGDNVWFADSSPYSADWTPEKYRTITLTEEPTDTKFIKWLEANATQQS